MAKLTRSQIRQIQRIINDHMEVLMQITIGDGKPSPRLVKKLGLPEAIVDLITTSYKYGKLGVLQGKDLSTMSESDVKKLMRNIKLTKSQQNSVDYSKIKAQQSIDSLSQRITSSVVTMAIQSDLSMWEAVKEVIPAAMENDTPRYKVIQELREKTGDWERDWHRVAHSEMWDAKLQGEAEAIMNDESPLSKDKGETLVYKRPAHNCCNKCRQLYLEKDGVTPKVFRLADLMANGTNYGKKQADWLPTLGILHPNCMCTLNVMPKDTTFDAQGNLVFKPNNK